MHCGAVRRHHRFSVNAGESFLEAKKLYGVEQKDDMKKIGDTLTADWRKKAGADGEAVIAACKKM